MGNATGVSAIAPGQVFTYLTNNLNGNTTTDGAFTLPKLDLK
jgi:hypothetical protein